MLTPKGKMLSDMYVYPLPSETEAFLVDVPAAGAEAVREQFAKVLPPRLARFEDASAQYRVVTLAGPGSAQVAGRLGLDLDPTEVGRLAENDILAGAWGILARSSELGVASYDLVIPVESGEGLEHQLDISEVGWASAGVRSTLRVEAATPEFGVDMDQSTIPVEAGIGDSAFDHDKGCYTGQEVIVRIRHRGHVNRHLRSLRLSESGAPSRAELYWQDPDKPVGTLTSVVDSPDAGPLALGYVRREVPVGGFVRVGSLEGPEAQVGAAHVPTP